MRVSNDILIESSQSRRRYVCMQIHRYMYLKIGIKPGLMFLRLYVDQRFCLFLGTTCDYWLYFILIHIDVIEVRWWGCWWCYLFHYVHDDVDEIDETKKREMMFTSCKHTLIHMHWTFNYVYLLVLVPWVDRLIGSVDEVWLQTVIQGMP